MKYNYKYLIYLAIGLIVITAIYFLFKRIIKGESEVKDEDKFLFYRGKDSDGNDLIYNPELAGNIGKMATICSSFKECKGFNSAGYFKSKINPMDTWKFYENKGEKEGLYVKKV